MHRRQPLGVHFTIRTEFRYTVTTPPRRCNCASVLVAFPSFALRIPARPSKQLLSHAGGKQRMHPGEV